MGKNKANIPNRPRANVHYKPSPQPQAAAAPVGKKSPSLLQRLPLPPVWVLFTVGVFVWAAFYYSSVFQVSREYSFWSNDSGTMDFFLSQPHGWLRYIGRAMLTLYHYPLLGGLLLAVMLGLGSALLGYCLRLPVSFLARNSKRQSLWHLAVSLVQYVPALVYMGIVTEKGLDIFFEAETGYILGIPFVVFAALLLLSVILRLAFRHPLPLLWNTRRTENKLTYSLHLLASAVGFAAVLLYGHLNRPYVRTICRMMVCQYNQDWEGVQNVARDNAHQSNRIMAAYYAAALVHTDQVGSRVYDIRLEYDVLNIHGMDGHQNNGVNLYLPEGNYHAGLVETAYHSCMESMVMTGPTLRLLKLMTKCALLRNEWELARKYLRILDGVPFEGDFCRKYRAMLYHPERVNADAETAVIRELEPVQDSFENQHQAPTFMGYNLNLLLARSPRAWNNSVAVCLYTKLLPQFAERLGVLVGTTLPKNFADGALLASRKYPEILQAFPELKTRAPRLDAYIESIQTDLRDSTRRAAYGPQHFDEQKGYFPHYYFFGNLRATKAGYTGESLMKRNAGVN